MKLKIGLLLLFLSFMTCGAQTLTVASYNLRNANPKDEAQGDGWKQRYPVIADLIHFHDFDIFGAQEVRHNQLTDMLEALPDYDYIGVGRDDGKEKGEYSPIFYKRERFKLLDSGHFWLAEDYTKPVKGWDAAYVRICTWGRFLDRESHKRFWLFTLHTDHKGEQSQIESCRLVLDRIKKMCHGERVVLTGDFNVRETSTCHSIICESGILSDAYDRSPIRLTTTGTENWFNPDIKTFRRIDHIFITPRFTPLRYGILTDTYRVPTDVPGKYRAHTPSDHFPVVVELAY